MVNTKHDHHDFAFYSYALRLIFRGKTLYVSPSVHCDYLCSSFFALSSIFLFVILARFTFTCFCFSMYPRPALFWFLIITIYYPPSHLLLYYIHRALQQGLSILYSLCFLYTILKTYLFAFLYTCPSRFVLRI